MPKRRRVSGNSRNTHEAASTSHGARNHMDEDSTDEDIGNMPVAQRTRIISNIIGLDELPSTSGSANRTAVNFSPNILEDNVSSNASSSSVDDYRPLVPLFPLNLESSGEENEVVNVPTTPTTTTTANTTTFSTSTKKDASTSPLSTLGRFIACEENEDEGITCNICLEPWEISGDHRLISIKCGHLFGEKCLRQWLKVYGNTTCPSCKAQTCVEDIRFIYAKRVCLLDRTEEERLRQNLVSTEEQVATLQTKLCDMRRARDESEQKKLDYKKQLMALKEKTKVARSINNLDGRMADLIDYVTNSIDPIIIENNIGNTKINNGNYKIYLNHSIQLNGDHGCRVMVYAKVLNSLFCSVKTQNPLFNGQGIRVVDLHTQRQTSLTLVTHKIIRDICINSDDKLLAVTCLEPNAKMYDTRTMRSAIHFPNIPENLWSCAYDCIDDTNNIYFGGQGGHCFIYDIRSPTNIRLQFETPGDNSPVIQVAAVAKNDYFPKGGVIVCKLQSLWFFEFTGVPSTMLATKLPLRGPFLSLRFNNDKQNLLLQTRSIEQIPSKFIVAFLLKDNGEPMLNVRCSFNAGCATPLMTRQAQINVPDNILSLGYIQDLNIVGLYDQRKMDRIQSLSISDTIYDMCPIYDSNSICVAALSDKKIRMFQLEGNGIV